MSRIYYRGKFYDYPIKPAERAARTSARSRRCAAWLSYLWVPRPAAEGPVDARGLHRRQLRLAALQALLQDLQREGLGRAPRRRSRPTGVRSASRTCRCSRAVWEPIRAKVARSAATESKQVTSLIEEFNYPKYGPGQMWETLPELVTAKGTKVVFDTNVTKIEHADGRAVAVTAESGGVTNRYECTDVISSMPISALLEAMDPPVPAEVTKAADGTALPRLHDRRARGARGVRLPRQLDLHPRPRRRGRAASRTSARGRRTW